MRIRLIIIAYRKIPQLSLLCVLISFLSCAENKTGTYEWMWGDSYATENQTTAFAGYNLGCTRFEDIEFQSNIITFSCGYRIDEVLPREAKHYDGEMRIVIDDGPLDDFEITGVVLLASVTQKGLLKTGDISGEFASDVLRVAKTVDEIERAEEVSFENVSLTVDNPKCAEEFEKCWGEVLLTFIICWDNSKTGTRAYQFLRPTIIYENPRDCDAFRGNPRLAQGLGVYWPLIDKYATQMDVAPDPENWTDWIDEILPRP